MLAAEQFSKIYDFEKDTLYVNAGILYSLGNSHMYSMQRDSITEFTLMFVTVACFIAQFSATVFSLIRHLFHG